LTVLYCSDETIKGYKDKEFGVEVKWDTPILEGHEYIFLKNNARKPSIYNGFFGLVNWEVISVLKKNKDATLILHGWNRMTFWIAMIYCKISGIPFWIHSENPLSQELQKSSLNRSIKKIFLGMIFRWSDRLCYIGEESKRFYQYYAGNHKSVFMPYSVDNRWFQEQYAKVSDKKDFLKQGLGLPDDKVIILFSGKYIEKKRPMDLIRAAEICKDLNAFFVFMGDGELRKEMEMYIKEKALKNITLTGFKNQSEIPGYFASADVFVLPSGAGETWGLVVNEAMNFNLPIVVSDIVGSSKDLVENGVNGYIYPCGNVELLAEKIKVLIQDAAKRKRFGDASLLKIDNYSNTVRKNNIKSALLVR
ncbi:MAG: glycosyltransferase family 4 protein, partial [Cytophaga sp.]|uniref:glycosyltransferase family 4 protein n=1 Tax=Cytophaga sp. TaxID=29535 RepID=UPI003F80FE9E